MSLDPILTADPVVQLHAACASLALVLGPVALYRKKRDRTHKVLGYVWVLAMAMAAGSSFGIHGFGLVGPFSPLHLLALLVFWSLYEAIRKVIAGDIAAHRAIMRNLYWRGVMIAGLFNFLPGRTTNRVFMDENRALGYIVIALGLSLVIYGIWRQTRREKNHKKNLQNPLATVQSIH